MQAHSLENQLNPKLHQKKNGQQAEGNYSLYSTFVRLHLECWVHIRSLQHMKDMKLLEQVQQKATKITIQLSGTPLL